MKSAIFALTQIHNCNETNYGILAQWKPHICAHRHYYLTFSLTKNIAKEKESSIFYHLKQCPQLMCEAVVIRVQKGLHDFSRN